MRSEFAANVSHELKTPLTSIKGFTDMMSSGMVKDPEDQKRFITMIGVEVDRLIELINDVLKISELESVVMPQSDDRANVLSVAEECRAALGQMAEAAKISVNLSGDNAEVAVAPGRLRELLTNLMENGIKYNEPGGRVDVQAAQRDGKVAITVSDTGIGIPKESRERVFERFYRVDKGRARKTGGTGLGLSIVKHIVLLYGKHFPEERAGQGDRDHGPVSRRPVEKRMKAAQLKLCRFCSARREDRPRIKNYDFRQRA
ncbi:MAG: sensor histidine kinase [Intestinimonas sp.]